MLALDNLDYLRINDLNGLNNDRLVFFYHWLVCNFDFFNFNFCGLVDFVLASVFVLFLFSAKQFYILTNCLQNVDYAGDENISFVLRLSFIDLQLVQKFFHQANKLSLQN